MIRRNRASLLLGILAFASLTDAAVSGDYIGGRYAEGRYNDGRVVRRIGDRCAPLGEGFVDVGNGVCGRVSRSLRVYAGPRNVTTEAWAGNGTSTTAMRSDGAGLLPGATGAQHLRVRGNLDSYSPFR